MSVRQTPSPTLFLLAATLVAVPAALPARGDAPAAAATAPGPATETLPPGKVPGIEAEGRPISAIRVAGLKRIPELLVQNQIRVKINDPYLAKAVNKDVIRITELGRFDRVVASVTPGPGNSVVLTYEVTELRLMDTIEIVGAKIIENDKLREKIRLRPGDPIDRFLLDQSRDQIRRAYEDKGCYETKVDIDEPALAEGNLRLLVSEGPRLHLRDIRFEGNRAFPTPVLEHELKSDTYMLVFVSGWLNRERLELDSATIRDYYRNRGWLDAQVGRRIDISRAQRSAVCTFVVDEGPRYAIRNINVSFVDRAGGKPLPAGARHTFTPAQLQSALALHPGDPYEKTKVDQSVRNIEDLYGRLGHLAGEADNSAPICRVDRVYHDDKRSVSLTVTIAENNPTTVGAVTVIGNANTQTRVAQRELLGMTPGRPFDRTRFEYTKENLSNTPYFGESSITLLGADGDPVRDAVVQVKEKSTGSISFGVNVSSDIGFGANTDYTQRNFDIMDPPRNWDDFWSGRSFRGAGQTFNIALSPGNRQSNYAVSFTEPSLFETDNYFSSSASYSSFVRQEWEEAHANLNLGVGRRFGRLWSAGVNTQLETYNINSMQSMAPTVAYDQAGTTTATIAGFNLTRSTVDSVMEPGHGMKDMLSLERYGAMGGEVDFTKISLTHQHFWTLEKDFLGRKTTLALRGQLAYIPEENAPFFYNFYAGGHRSLRGFDFRGVGPRGIRKDNGQPSESSIGGNFMALAGLEYSEPIYEDVVRWVLFTDQGTVADGPDFGQWRVSVGTGLRIKIPFLGQAPLALDFSFPVRKFTGDETQIFSFDFSMPLR